MVNYIITLIFDIGVIAGLWGIWVLLKEQNKLLEDILKLITVYSESNVSVLKKDSRVPKGYGTVESDPNFIPQTILAAIVIVILVGTGYILGRLV